MELEYFADINGKHKKIYAFDDCMDCIKYRYNKAIEDVERLKEENRKLREEYDKDKEIKAIKEYADEMHNDLIRGFPVSETEMESIQEWMKEHNNYHQQKGESSGAIGGRYTYEFIPTSIGTVGQVVCTCGETFTFQEL